MSENDVHAVHLIVRAVFVLALLGFGIAFALTGQSVFAGGCVTAALGLAGSLFREYGERKRPEPEPLPLDLDGDREDSDAPDR